MTTIAIVGQSGNSFCHEGWGYQTTIAIVGQSGTSFCHEGTHPWACIVFQPRGIKYDITRWPKMLSMIVGIMIYDKYTHIWSVQKWCGRLFMCVKWCVINTTQKNIYGQTWSKPHSSKLDVRPTKYIFHIIYKHDQNLSL